MTALDTDDLAVITGPLEWNNDIDWTLAPQTNVGLIAGEVVRIVESEDRYGTVMAHGLTSEIDQYINASSLTPLSEIQKDPEVLWGETPYVVFSDIHDYVYEGDE